MSSPKPSPSFAITAWTAVHHAAQRAAASAHVVSARAAARAACATPPPPAVVAALGASGIHPPAARFVRTAPWAPDTGAGFLLGMGGHRPGGVGFTLGSARVGAWQRAEAVDWRRDGSLTGARSRRGVARALGWVWVGDDPTLNGGSPALGGDPAECAGRSLQARDLTGPVAVWPADGGGSR